MLNTGNQENVAKSIQTNNLLLRDLRELVKSSKSILTEPAIEILRQSLFIEWRLKRIEMITRTKEKYA
jgi:hypothetical protein